MITTDINLPQTPFVWSKFDCFTLAKYVRFNIDYVFLPDISWLYRRYTERSQPKDLVLTVVQKYCKQADNPVTGTLVILEVDKTLNLGTIFNDDIIYMGSDRATKQSIARMNCYLHSFWNYSED